MFFFDMIFEGYLLAVAFLRANYYTILSNQISYSMNTLFFKHHIQYKFAFETKNFNQTNE